MVDRRPLPHAHGEVVQIASHGVCGKHTLSGMAETVECLEFSGGVCGLINGFVSAHTPCFQIFSRHVERWAPSSLFFSSC